MMGLEMEVLGGQGDAREDSEGAWDMLECLGRLLGWEKQLW